MYLYERIIYFLSSLMLITGGFQAIGLSIRENKRLPLLSSSSLSSPSIWTSHIATLASSTVEEPTIETSTVSWRIVTLQPAPMIYDIGEEVDSLGTKVKEGKAIVVLQNVATEDDCARIVEICRQAAAVHKREQKNTDLDKPGLVRLPTIASANRAAAVGMPCAEPIPKEADDICQSILETTMRTIDNELQSSLVEELFGRDKSLYDLYVNDQLDWSSREPAVNVYTEGGEFAPHLDAQALTVLMTLSSSDEFEGGGTAFWDGKEPPANQPPAMVFKPKVGTIFLFGGSLYHAGIPVRSGSRTVYVASFSPPGSREERARLYSQSSRVF